MATGIQGNAALSAAVWSVIYTVPASTVWTGQVNFVNRGATLAKVRLAYGTGTSGASGEFVEYDYPLAPAGSAGNVLSRTGEVLGAGYKVLAYSDSADVDIVVSGYEA
jgi:hypothetical protein